MDLFFLLLGQFGMKNSKLRSKQALFCSSGLVIIPRFNKVSFRISKVNGHSFTVGTPTWHRSFLDHNVVGLESLDQVLPRLFTQRETEMIQIAATLPGRGTLLPHLFWKPIDDRVRIEAHRRKRHHACAVFLQTFSFKHQYVRIEIHHFFIVFHVQNGNESQGGQPQAADLIHSRSGCCSLNEAFIAFTST